MLIRVLSQEKRPTRLSVDFPKPGEQVTSQHYTLRISAPSPAQSVEVSLDGGPWLRCRESAGHWWYDWSGYSSGDHQVVARFKTPASAVVTGQPHEFGVELRLSARP